MYTLLSGPMVHTLFPCFPGKMVYTIAFFLLCDLGVGRQTEKRGCILFFPCAPARKITYMSQTGVYASSTELESGNALGALKALPPDPSPSTGSKF